MYVVMTPSFLPFLSLTILSSHAFARKPHFITNSQKKGVSSARISRGSRLSVIAGFVSHVSGFRRLSVWIRLRRCNKLQVLSFPPFPLGQEKFFLHLIRREEEKLFLSLPFPTFLAYTFSSWNALFYAPRKTFVPPPSQRCSVASDSSLFRRSCRKGGTSRKGGG